jgi:hypothetical protein
MTMLSSGGKFGCMVCGADLWEVPRYVRAGAIVACEPCVGALYRAFDESDEPGEITIVLPPKVYGDAPDAAAPPAIAEAFVRTFGSAYGELSDYLEDAQELGPYLGDAANRFGGGVTQFTARVDGIRFVRTDRADVRFQIMMNGTPMGMPFQGSAALGSDGKWRVTRETVLRVVPGGGPPLGRRV